MSGPLHFIEFDHDKYPGYGGGADNYYNNGEYTTGASYFNRSLGSPFLISPEYNKNGLLGFRHNRVRAWHLGISGQVCRDGRDCDFANYIARTYTKYLIEIGRASCRERV